MWAKEGGGDGCLHKSSVCKEQYCFVHKIPEQKEYLVKAKRQGVRLVQTSSDREDDSSMVTAGATANTTEGNSRASRESGPWCSHSQKQRNKALTLAHAQTIVATAGTPPRQSVTD